ncbi:MAG TPA: ABC transporter ATP-binding protein [Solirubrobacterales bacterium]|jgi:lipopolysaccharide transport system ATP-binding protein|nr:ABC transporter ATP-binding protein [Solirubrobacterales bacterium]
MADPTAIEIQGLGKRYALGLSRRGYGTLREAIVEAARRPLRRQPRKRSEADQLWALKDVSATIEKGEVVGLIGHNGAGKSTLLKILSRITEPSTGHADVTGRVGSLLEVGTGFHPELTGRENVFLNGSILGMRKSEIRKRFDEIVEFAEIERFLDTPVKRYSSGMSVRLAFAVAAHLDPEILLVDEVLAVGDAAFQRKSLGKMSEVATKGRTIVFVSHNLAIIQALCERGILLERGRIVNDGPVEATVNRYLAGLERSATADLLEREDRDGRSWLNSMISRVAIRDESGAHPDIVMGGRPVTIEVEVTEVLPALECRITIANSLGQPVTSFDSEVSAPADTRGAGTGSLVECELPSLPLAPGRYRIDVVLKARNQIQDGLQAAAFFDVEPGLIGGRPMPPAGAAGSVVLPHSWRLP